MKGKVQIGWTQGGWERRINKKGKKDFTPVSKEGGSLKQEPPQLLVHRLGRGGRVWHCSPCAVPPNQMMPRLGGRRGQAGQCGAGL
ncbi:MAG: hypothetical protein MUO29_09625, partial [Desulfobacterales bacterium]|nr:hypothetical protein [Desulfobacterales bacterium]